MPSVCLAFSLPTQRLSHTKNSQSAQRSIRFVGHSHEERVDERASAHHPAPDGLGRLRGGLSLRVSDGPSVLRTGARRRRRNRMVGSFRRRPRHRARRTPPSSATRSRIEVPTPRRRDAVDHRGSRRYPWAHWTGIVLQFLVFVGATVWFFVTLAVLSQQV